MSRRRRLFSSSQGITFSDQPEETLEFFGSMIVMDEPAALEACGCSCRRRSRRRPWRRSSRAFTTAARALVAAAADEGRVRLRPVLRRAAAAADHLRHARRAGGRRAAGLRLDEHHPRRRRSRLRRHVRRSPARGVARDVQLRPGARRGPPGDHPRRGPRVDADARRGRRQAAHDVGVRFVLHPPRRGRQRDDAQRDQLGHEDAHRASRPAPATGRPTSTAWRRPRSTRSCAGRAR